MMQYRIRFDEGAAHGVFDSFDEAAEAALRAAPDGAQLHVEASDGQAPSAAPAQHWIFDRDQAQWLEQT